MDPNYLSAYAFDFLFFAVIVGITGLLIALNKRTTKSAFITLAIGFGVMVVRYIIVFSLDMTFIIPNLMDQGMT